MSIADRKWQEFEVREIFPEIQRGKRLKTADHVPGSVPYVSSSAINNGVDAFIGNAGRVRKFGECLTVANSGSVGSSFFHEYEFIASDHVTALKSPAMNKYIYLFVASVMERLKEKYSFNREINEARINREKIILPVDDFGRPDFAFMEGYMREHESRILRLYEAYSSGAGGSDEALRLDGLKWGEFTIKDIFMISSGKRLRKEDMTTGNKPFIGASDSNNGVTAFVSNSNASEDSNILGVNYDGSVVENFYHPYSCIFSDSVKRFRLKEHEGNAHIYLFMKTTILKQKSKYTYGYKFNEQRMQRQKILLPIDENGQPDYAFMEKVERYERHGRADVPEFMIHISKGDLSGVDHIHFVYSTDEVLYGAKQNFICACEKYGVKYTVRERPGMIHCYAMLPYFKESKEDFEELAAILAE